MHAITIPAPGGMVWSEVPEPEAGPGKVMIEVAAAGVNRADLLQVAGHYPPPPGAPEYPGLEVSGTADGAPVCALLGGGGYAERVAVDSGHVLPVPAKISLIEAAGLPEAACTVWSNLTMVANLARGETVLIHGGGSGIGTFAIQYAKALGAHVITTARGFKHKALKDLGADECFDYTVDDWSAVRADVVLDIMGASYLERNLKVLNTGGRLVIIALQGGTRAEIDLATVMRGRKTVAGTTLRARPDEEKTKIIQGVRREVWPLIETGAIKPVIDRSFPLPQAAQAHALMASNQHVGKVLLLPA
ncbi:MAG TPA: NAD(P)H-quinone oxidoreductase [Candidatus Limnocylindrales bacterium]